MEDVDGDDARDDTIDWSDEIGLALECQDGPLRSDEVQRRIEEFAVDRLRQQLVEAFGVGACSQLLEEWWTSCAAVRHLSVPEPELASPTDTVVSMVTPTVAHPTSDPQASLQVAKTLIELLPATCKDGLVRVEVLRDAPMPLHSATTLVGHVSEASSIVCSLLRVAAKLLPTSPRF